MSNLFRGITEISVDQKGRIAIPTRFREQIKQRSSGEMVITLDPRTCKCLLIYLTPDFDESQREVEKLPNIDDPVAHQLQQVFIGCAQDVEMDQQGRVLVPAALRKLVELDKTATLVGQSTKFELWPQEVWDARVNAWKENGLGGEGKEGVLSGLSI